MAEPDTSLPRVPGSFGPLTRDRLYHLLATAILPRLWMIVWRRGTAWVGLIWVGWRFLARTDGISIGPMELAVRNIPFQILGLNISCSGSGHGGKRFSVIIGDITARVVREG